MVTPKVPASRRAGRQPRALALFAALLMSFMATHCVEIDDRELEESEGLPPDCRRDPDDTDCFACGKAACCDQLLACFDSIDCLYYVDCGGSCDDDACLVACGIAFPEGEALFFDFNTCGADACGC